MDSADCLSQTVALVASIRGPDAQQDLSQLVNEMSDRKIRSVVLMQTVVISSLMSEYARLIGGDPETVLTLFAARAQQTFPPKLS